MLLGDTIFLDSLDDANAYRQEVIIFTNGPKYFYIQSYVCRKVCCSCPVYLFISLAADLFKVCNVFVKKQKLFAF